MILYPTLLMSWYSWGYYRVKSCWIRKNSTGKGNDFQHGRGPRGGQSCLFYILRSSMRNKTLQSGVCFVLEILDGTSKGKVDTTAETRRLQPAGQIASKSMSEVPSSSVEDKTFEQQFRLGLRYDPLLPRA